MTDAETGRCPHCGFDPMSVTPASAADAARAFARRYQAPLTRFLPGEDGDAVLRTPAADGGPSAIALAAAAAERFDHARRQIEQLRDHDGDPLAVDEPETTDGTAIEPGALAATIAAAANALADTLAALTAEEWEHTGQTTGSPVTVLDLAAAAIHSGSHGLLEIGRQLRAVRQGPTT